MPTKPKHLVQFVAASLFPHKNLVTDNVRTEIATSNGFTLVQSLYDHHPHNFFIIMILFDFQHELENTNLLKCMIMVQFVHNRL